MSAIPGLAALGLHWPCSEHAAGLSWNHVMALAAIYHYFLKGVRAGLQITRAKLFHIVHNTKRNRTLVPWPQAVLHWWGWGSWRPKIFSKLMNLRGQNMPKLTQSLCCLLVIFLRAAPNAALLPFTWLRHQCWTLTLPSFSQQGQALGLSYIPRVTLSPLLVFNQLAALHWWHQNQNCYWHQHPGQSYFCTASPRSRWRQNSASFSLDLFWPFREGILLPS